MVKPGRGGIAGVLEGRFVKTRGLDAVTGDFLGSPMAGEEALFAIHDLCGVPRKRLAVELEVASSFPEHWRGRPGECCAGLMAG